MITQFSAVARRGSRFAARLKELRARAGLTQAALARLSGVPLASIRGFEISPRLPGFDNLLRLAAGLGVELNAFAMEPEEKGKGGAGSSA
jgi:transcriptional regulator with XRE-family HTH domain